MGWALPRDSSAGRLLLVFSAWSYALLEYIVFLTINLNLTCIASQPVWLVYVKFPALTWNCQR
jgi:hypothetical protein